MVLGSAYFDYLKFNISQKSGSLLDAFTLARQILDLLTLTLSHLRYFMCWKVGQTFPSFILYYTAKC